MPCYRYAYHTVASPLSFTHRNSSSTPPTRFSTRHRPLWPPIFSIFSILRSLGSILASVAFLVHQDPMGTEAMSIPNSAWPTRSAPWSNQRQQKNQGQAKSLILPRVRLLPQMGKTHSRSSGARLFAGKGSPFIVFRLDTQQTSRRKDIYTDASPPFLSLSYISLLYIQSIH